MQAKAPCRLSKLGKTGLKNNFNNIFLDSFGGHAVDLKASLAPKPAHGDHSAQLSLHQSTSLEPKPENLRRADSTRDTRSGDKTTSRLKSILKSFLLKAGFEMYYEVLEEFLAHNKEEFFEVTEKFFAFVDNESKREETLTESKQPVVSPVKSDSGQTLSKLQQSNTRKPRKGILLDEDSSVSVQSIESVSSSNSSTFLIVNDQLAHDFNALFAKKTVFPAAKIDHYDDIISKICVVLNGSQPRPEWLQTWRADEKQVFWLLLAKMFHFSPDWATELTHSVEFPAKTGFIKEYDKSLYSGYLHTILSAILREIIARRSDSTQSASNHFDYLIGSVTSLDFNYFQIREILEKVLHAGHLRQKRKKTRTRVILKMVEMKQLSRFLGFFPNIEFYFGIIHDSYFTSGRFSAGKIEIIRKRVSVAIQKIKKAVQDKRLPRIGIKLEPRGKRILGSFLIHKSANYWKKCFQKIADMIGIKFSKGM